MQQVLAGKQNPGENKMENKTTIEVLILLTILITTINTKIIATNEETNQTNKEERKTLTTPKKTTEPTTQTTNRNSTKEHKWIILAMLTPPTIAILIVATHSLLEKLANQPRIEKRKPVLWFNIANQQLWVNKATTSG